MSHDTEATQEYPPISEEHFVAERSRREIERNGRWINFVDEHFQEMEIDIFELRALYAALFHRFSFEVEAAAGALYLGYGDAGFWSQRPRMQTMNLDDAPEEVKAMIMRDLQGGNDA